MAREIRSDLKIQDDFYILPFHRGFDLDRFIFKFIGGLKVLRGEPNSFLISNVDDINPSDIEHSKQNDIADDLVETFLENVVLSVGETDLRASIKRQLKLSLLEILPKIYKMKARGEKKYVCDAELHKLLKEMDVKAEKSAFITFYYKAVGIAEKTYKFFREIVCKFNRCDLFKKPRLYVFKNPGKKKIFWVASSSHRNKSFINQAVFLREHYECYILNTESLWEPSEIPGIEEIVLDNWNSDEKKNLIYSCFKVDRPLNGIDEYLKARCDQIIESIGGGIQYYASLFDHVFAKFSIDLCVVGQTDYWITSLASKISKERGVRTAFFQDLFWFEGYPDPDIRTDYVVSFQRSIGFKVKCGTPKIIRNQELKEISLGNGHSVVDRGNYISAREKTSNRLGFSIQEKLLVLIACHPVFEPHTATRKYLIEKTLLNELAGESVFVIVKLHPQDDSGITKEILNEIGSDNMVLVKDFDFDLYLKACDLFIGTGSCSLHQAISAGKVVAVMNYEGESQFPVAIRYKAAFSLKKEGDVHQILRNLPSLDIMKKNSSRYLQECHNLQDSHESFSKEVENILADSTYAGAK
jgi:hypothetical protein